MWLWLYNAGAVVGYSSDRKHLYTMLLSGDTFILLKSIKSGQQFRVMFRQHKYSTDYRCIDNSNGIGYAPEIKLVLVKTRRSDSNF